MSFPAWRARLESYWIVTSAARLGSSDDAEGGSESDRLRIFRTIRHRARVLV